MLFFDAGFEKRVLADRNPPGRFGQNCIRNKIRSVQIYCPVYGSRQRTRAVSEIDGLDQTYTAPQIFCLYEAANVPWLQDDQPVALPDPTSAPQRPILQPVSPSSDVSTSLQSILNDLTDLLDPFEGMVNVPESIVMPLTEGTTTTTASSSVRDSYTMTTETVEAGVQTDRGRCSSKGVQTPMDELYLPPGINVSRMINELFEDTETSAREIALRLCNSQANPISECNITMELVAHTIAEAQRRLVRIVIQILDEARPLQHNPRTMQEVRRMLETYCTSLLNRPHRPEPVIRSNNMVSNDLEVIDLTEEDNA